MTMAWDDPMVWLTAGTTRSSFISAPTPFGKRSRDGSMSMPKYRSATFQRSARPATRASRYQALPAVTTGSLVTVRVVSLPLFIGHDHQHRTRSTASMIKQSEKESIVRRQRSSRWQRIERVMDAWHT